MKDDYQNTDIDDIAEEYDSPEKVEKAGRIIDENLWEKLERVGKRISFAKDIHALYNYFTAKNVSWYRKSIVAGALIYFIAPIDTIPDLTPLFGYLDDLGVIAAVLKFLGSELMQYYED